MPTLNDMRRANLRRLIDAMGGPTALALKVGYANGAYISQLVGPNPTRPFGEKAARHMEAQLSLPYAWVDMEDAPMTFSQSAVSTGRAKAARVMSDGDNAPAPFRVVEMPANGARDPPVFGQVQGGFDGVEVDYQTPVDYIRRPPSLIGSPKACGVYVTGDSMEPRYYAGEIVLVDPRKPVRSGDFVVVELPDHHAIVKRLIRRNDNGATFGQLNPISDETLPRERIVGIYRIVGTVTE